MIPKCKIALLNELKNISLSMFIAKGSLESFPLKLVG